MTKKEAIVNFWGASQVVLRSTGLPPMIVGQPILWFYAKAHEDDSIWVLLWQGNQGHPKGGQAF